MSTIGRHRGFLIGVCASAAAHLAAVVLIALLPTGPAAIGVSSSNATASSPEQARGGPVDLSSRVAGDGASEPGLTTVAGADSLRATDRGAAVVSADAATQARSSAGDSAIARTVTRLANDVAPTIPEVAAHLWESALFAVAVGALTLLVRRNGADVRYRLWLAASLKLFVPFSLLVTMGGHLAWILPVQPLTETIAVIPMASLEASIAAWPAEPRMTRAAPPTVAEALTVAAVTVWLLGMASVGVMRFRVWRRIRAAVRVSTPFESPHLVIPHDVDVRSAPGLLEPGVVGWRRPILLLPADLGTHLTTSELDAVIAHEMCHVRRWDNHTAMLHMLAEAVFWFHPLVWWIGARLVSERERACDEAVLRQGSEPAVYAHAIVKTCARYVASPLACVAGVTGSDLHKRIETIMTNQLPRPVNLWRRVALGTAIFLAVAVPLGSGMRNGAIVAAAQTPTNPPGDARFEVASVKPNPAGRAAPTSTDVQPGGRYVARNMPLRMLIGTVYRVPSLQLAGGPAWIESAHFDIEAKADRELVSSGGTRPLDAALRRLLAERFKLVVHTETRQMPVYELVRARRDGQLGPNLIASTRTDCDAVRAAIGRGGNGQDSSPPPPPGPGQAPVCGARNVSSALWVDSLPLSFLAGILTSEVNRPVIDKTGLSGRYNLRLTWTPDELPRIPADAPNDLPAIDPNGPSIFTALEEQLGLRLESATGPVEVVVIDSVEPPTPN